MSTATASVPDPRVEALKDQLIIAKTQGEIELIERKIEALQKGEQQ